MEDQKNDFFIKSSSFPVACVMWFGTQPSTHTYHGDVVPVEKNLIQFGYSSPLGRDLAVQTKQNEIFKPSTVHEKNKHSWMC